ncbi:hypothetical protein ACFQS1_35115 [Paractinoplanes rhizophilus]|uniref:Uncharacterized protein n=1 Tax=Paractinoplanes rhizophilus TaxID=1416877 RepID=A0ABW2I2V6_9ACTN
MTFMSPPGVPPEWSSADYFDDSESLRPFASRKEVVAAIHKVVASTSRTRSELARYAGRLVRAANRLAQAADATRNSDLMTASATLRKAADAVEHARALLVQSKGYLDGPPPTRGRPRRR